MMKSVEKTATSTMTALKKTRPIYIMVAMCGNRGFANGNQIPWPKLNKDFEHYLTRSSPQKSGITYAMITGKDSWGCACARERSRSGLLNIIISRTLRADSDPYIHKVVPNLQSAIEYVTFAPIGERIHETWILGGQQNFKEALEADAVQRVYVTRIVQDFPADRFFPEFEGNFTLIIDDLVDSSWQEENGIQFRFEVYERNT